MSCETKLLPFTQTQICYTHFQGLPHISSTTLAKL
jgi:hypothetical protein